jgi:hypothetical protein
MDDFDELIPASSAARRRGCTCSVPAGPDLKADPACPVHGVAVFKRLLNSPEGRSAIKRLRTLMEHEAERLAS